MQAADARHRDYRARRRRSPLNRAEGRRLLVKSDVRAVLMVITDVVMAETEQMPFVQRDHAIQHLAANAPDPPFSDSVLPWTPNAGPDGFDSARLQKRAYVGAELAVAVEHDVAVWTRQRQRLPQLLHNPLARGMRRRVVPKNIVLGGVRKCSGSSGLSPCEPAVQRDDSFAVVADQPLCLLWWHTVSP